MAEVMWPRRSSDQQEVEEERVDVETDRLGFDEEFGEEREVLREQLRGVCC